MHRWVVTRRIQAPAAQVFATVADIAQFKRAIPHIVEVEYLSAARSGVGTRFRETRLMKGKRITTELEVTEWIANDHVRLVADTHGTVWDSLFAVSREQDATILTRTMNASSVKLLPRVMIPLIYRMVQKAVEGDMDAVKAWCEKGAPA